MITARSEASLSTLGVRALAVILVALVVSPAAPAAAAADRPDVPSKGAFVQEGVRQPVSERRRQPATPDQFTTPQATRPEFQPAATPEPPTVERCRAQPDAHVEPGDLGGWHINRYGWCAYGEYYATGRDSGTGEIIATLRADFTVLGYGNKGVRQFDYLVQLDNIVADGNIAWDRSVLKATVNECVDPQPSTTCMRLPRLANIPTWQAVNTYAVTFQSPDPGSGTGDNTAFASTFVDLDFSTPTQPEWNWEGGILKIAETRARYDSASYVGSPRGAIFPEAPLVFRVDGQLPDRDESARHIWDALHRPMITLPSWLGKTVPARLTRMYNPAMNDANRSKSIGQCEDFYGKYDGSLINCDEYPFASTYEGSKTGADRNNGLERHSVRLIDASDNQNVGRDLENTFFRELRILDGEKFDVVVDGLG